MVQRDRDYDHNDYEPTGSQNARDSAEMIPLEKLGDKPAKVMFGEPCIGRIVVVVVAIAIDVCCVPKAVAATTSWVPIPDVGYKSMPKEKVCLYPARSVEGPAKYGTVDTRERCFEQPKVDCFLRNRRNREIEMLLNTNLAIFVCDAKISPLSSLLHNKNRARALALSETVRTQPRTNAMAIIVPSSSSAASPPCDYGEDGVTERAFREVRLLFCFVYLKIGVFLSRSILARAAFDQPYSRVVIIHQSRAFTSLLIVIRSCKRFQTNL